MRVQLIDKNKHRRSQTPTGSAAEKVVTLPDDRPVEQEIIFKPEGLGPLQVEAVADLQQGELDHNDNTRTPTSRCWTPRSTSCTWTATRAGNTATSRTR